MRDSPEGIGAHFYPFPVINKARTDIRLTFFNTTRQKQSSVFQKIRAKGKPGVTGISNLLLF